MAERKIIVGARASLLSVSQAQGVIEILKQEYPAYSFFLKKIITSGDTHKNWQRDDMGIFVKEIEQALLDGEIDIAIHSMKDLPTQTPQKLKLAAVTKREDPRDCIILKDKTPLAQLKKGAVIGTSSLRRRAQLLRWRKDLQIKNLRGNLDTRIKKLIADEFDAIVVAMAGVIRLGAVATSRWREKWNKNFFIQPIPTSLILPAPGQGALALEVRARDKLMETLAQRINNQESFLCVSCERAFLRELGGGCRLPLGAWAEIKNGQMHLQVMVADRDGKMMIRLSQKAHFRQGERLGKALACVVLKKGGRKLLKEVR